MSETVPQSEEPQVTAPVVGSVPDIVLPDGQAAGKRKKNKKKKAEGLVSFSADADVWRTPWVTSLGMTEYESKTQRLHDEIVAYVNYMLPTEQEQRAREQVVARVGDVVRRRFSNATVAAFGSYAQGLYLPDGDMDLVMALPRDLDAESKKRTLFQLSAALRNSGLTHNVQVIHRARVPVLSFETAREFGSFKVDISINSSDGVTAVPIIANYLEKMPALRNLITLCKGFLSCNKLNCAADGGLSSYGLICMIICFLQLNPYSRAAEDIEKPLENESLGMLFIDLLDYYGNIFPYADSYISVAQGAVLPKAEKGWVSEAEPERLCIECLVNPDNDVGKPTDKIARIRAVLREAHLALLSYPFSITRANALGTILQVSGESLVHREHVKKIVDSGSLERALAEVKLPSAAFSTPRRQQFPNRPPRGQYMPAPGFPTPPAYGYGAQPYPGYPQQYGAAPAGSSYAPQFSYAPNYGYYGAAAGYYQYGQQAQTYGYSNQYPAAGAPRQHYRANRPY